MRPEREIAAEAVGLDPGAVAAILEGRHGDPFAVFGPFRDGDRILVRTFQPGAEAVEVVSRATARRSPARPGGPGRHLRGPHPGRHALSLRVHWPGGVHETEDPYSFGLLLGELDMHLIAEGQHHELGNTLGARTSWRSTA
jgi:1,4-alpha-glucan branching enzyme